MTGYDGLPYGAFFEGQSMFSVTDDGTGNIIVTFNPVGSALPSSTEDKNTIYNITTLPYYYSATGRYANLTEPAPVDSGQTHFFTGFNASGSVVTSIKARPSDPTTAIPVEVAYSYDA